MSAEMLLAVVAGTFALGGIVVGAGLTFLQAEITYRRKRVDDLIASEDRERAIFHGAFAVCNFLAERLDQWDSTRNIYALARSGIAQPYLAKLIERSPQDSERLMVSLVDLGIRLEAMLFAAGFSVGAGVGEPSESDLAEVIAAVDELARAVEVVQILLDKELPILSEDDLASLGTLSAGATAQ